ncbi:MAG: short-chain dehydrogenase [Pseudonocardiales bacterium]|nr:MAG: short-chain dehydrogenase [Pseudonocardiales bacterium]
MCLLTGAGGTLGTAFCRAYAAEYDIVAVCRRRTPDVPSQHESYVDPLAPHSELPDNDSRVFTVYSDLEQSGQVERVVDMALARFDRVDLLVNNAAYTHLRPHGFIDGDGALRDLDRYFAVNVGIPLRLAVRLGQRFWMHRDQDNRAHNRNVVNVSSLSGARVFPGQGQGVYAASKAALNHLTRHLAAEFAVFGVRVNALAPNSFPHIISTDSVAHAIARLDRDDVTGRILAINGQDAGNEEQRTSPQRQE